MNRKERNRKTLLISMGGLLLLIITPIGFYIWNFWESNIGSDPQIWGVFGDYFGGVLNPIISLASLCVLGYLTYLVAEQTNNESKRLFFLERRMLAFDDLAKNLKQINLLSEKVVGMSSMIKLYSRLPQDQALTHSIKALEKIRLSNVL